jgi:hypothetical protein
MLLWARTYQIAHNDLAFASARSGLGRGRLRCSGTGLFGILLNATDWGSSGWASSRATLGSSAISSSGSSLGRENLVQSLIKLARHDV